MSKHFHILLWLPLCYAVLFVTLWIRIYFNESVKFEEFVLEKQCNYAADSAMDAMLTQSNLHLDYADNDFVSLNPTVGKDDFVETMCMNFGYLVNETSRQRFEIKNMRSLVIATYDGVYCYTLLKEDNRGSYSLVQSPKIPYIYRDSENNQYALTLDKSKGYADQGDPEEIADEQNRYILYRLGEYIDMSERNEKVYQPSDDIQNTVLSNTVSEILNWSLYESLSEGRDETVELPSVQGAVDGSQPIDKPTIIGVVEGDRKVFTTSIIAGGIGGAQIIDNTDIIGCDLTNFKVGDSTFSGKYYAPDAWWNTHFVDNDTSTYANQKYFDSVFEAARAGYNNIKLAK